MSLVLDILIVVVLLGCLVHGLRRGFVNSVASILGLAAGAIAAWFVAPALGALVPDPTARLAVTLVVALVLLLIGSALGARIGGAVGRPLQRTPLGPVDRVLGGALQVVVGAVVVSVLASLAVTLGTDQIAGPVAGSVLVHQIGALTPAPLAQAVDGIRSTVVSAGISALSGSTSTGPRLH